MLRGTGSVGDSVGEGKSVPVYIVDIAYLDWWLAAANLSLFTANGVSTCCNYRKWSVNLSSVATCR